MASTRQRPQMCMVVMYMNEIIMFRFLYFNVRYRLTIFRVVILTWADKLSESNSSCLVLFFENRMILYLLYVQFNMSQTAKKENPKNSPREPPSSDMKDIVG